ncbi:hypothetical protein F4776DRAFT_624623 [Hypoxylon sp. NC0597]|nr:hypothetical protein F4776DRAFT_624623 [Hypoxylon sp. NC0597]
MMSRVNLQLLEPESYVTISLSPDTIDCILFQTYGHQPSIIMAPRRKEPSQAEADSGSEVDFSLNYQYTPSASIPQAMESIDKWKSKRSEIQKNIEKDFIEKLSALRNEMKARFDDESQKMSDHNKEQLRRLIVALKKRLECEQKICERLDSLRDDCAHIAMLVDAVYTGRKEAATQSANASNSNQLKN